MAFADIKLPIDVVPGTNPPVFVWRQTVDSVVGRKVVDHRDKIPQVLEVAVERIISIAKQLLMDNATLRGTIQGLSDRVEALQEASGKRVDTHTPAALPRKGKG